MNRLVLSSTQLQNIIHNAKQAAAHQKHTLAGAANGGGQATKNQENKDPNDSNKGVVA